MADAGYAGARQSGRYRRVLIAAHAAADAGLPPGSEGVVIDRLAPAGPYSVGPPIGRRRCPRGCVGWFAHPCRFLVLDSAYGDDAAADEQTSQHSCWRTAYRLREEPR